MTQPFDITRRRALLSGLAVATLAASPGFAQPTAIHVVKGTGCECCNAWVAYLRDEGFAVTEEERYGTLLMTYKNEVGVPQKMISCHTGMVDGYVLEGHVPAADIPKLLKERPKVTGISVPGMPIGSPGMEQGGMKEPYDTVAFTKGGAKTVFARHR